MDIHGTPQQQKESAFLGMWLFIITELLLFGGAFLVFFVYHRLYTQAFTDASHHLSVLLGSINTFILLTSSLTVALGVDAAHHKRKSALSGYFIATILLAVVFLCIKGVEYHEKFAAHLFPGAGFVWTGENAPQVRLFFGLYFAMTGLHATHVILGMAALGAMVFLSQRGYFDNRESTAVELSGLYWHLVDIVWIFLFPLLYLMGRHP